MSCFVVPLVEAIVVSACRKRAVQSARPVWRELPALEKMLWGGTLMLIVDHVINGTRGVNFNVKAIEVSGQALDSHRDGSVSVENATLTMIPYYAWNHRGPGLMEVWMAQTIAAAGNY